MGKKRKRSKPVPSSTLAEDSVGVIGAKGTLSVRKARNVSSVDILAKCTAIRYALSLPSAAQGDAVLAARIMGLAAAKWEPMKLSFTLQSAEDIIEEGREEEANLVSRRPKYPH